ncbi:MAG: urea carboxylase-associated family protein [Bdellovibrionaceae bacterium]|nr:urea carboxylase-associated family protein [Bdellovibrio sp.]
MQKTQKQFNTILKQRGVSFQLLRGQTLTVTEVEAAQVSDLFCFNLHDFSESLSSGRSIDYNDQIFLTSGHSLYSNRSEVMLKIIEDTCGRHDFLMTPCSLKMFQIVANNSEYHPSCHENLAKSFAAYGISPDQISTTFNIFMNVQVAPDGAIRINASKAKKGDWVTFKAEMDLLIGLTACSHEETNQFKFSEIGYAIS